MDNVVVTQADRLKSATTQDFYHRITQVDYDAILNGEWDDEECVIMEARHRIESQRPLIEALELIRQEAQREEGRWAHLKRVIAAQSAAAIQQAKGE